MGINGLGINGVTYGVPPEPKRNLDDGNGDMEIRMLDLRDDLDELTETVHKQWVQFSEDDLKIKKEFSERCGKILTLVIANMVVTGGLICSMIAMLIR